MAIDPEARAHQEWLGYVQPQGLVVSAPALLAAQAFVNRAQLSQLQEKFNEIVEQQKLPLGPDGAVEEVPVIPHFRELAYTFFEWQSRDLAGAPGGPDLPESLKVTLTDYGETLAPTYAVADPNQQGSWLMLIDTLQPGQDPDATPKQEDRRWHASPQARFERLLRETKVPIGLLLNGTHVRLVYAPAGESAGYITFPVRAMADIPGRPILGALHMLLHADRLFSMATNQRLPAILQQSRKYQNQVSERLAEQVLGALHELLRGFQAAHEATRGELLKEALEGDPKHIYGGLLTSLLRLVFILYAEDRSLLPTDAVYTSSYSVTGLFEKLREDAARYPDTMDQRYGAWAQLLTLFRLIHDGGGHGEMHLPARHGKLFDPDAYPFLEGRTRARLPEGAPTTLPRVSDGVIYRILEDLLLLDGERLSYRTLDVEQIGSVYEAMMGFELRMAEGPSVAVRPENVVVNLQAILAEIVANRPKTLKEEAGCDVTGKALEPLKAAKTVDELVAALGKKVSKFTPNILPKGAMFLQPTDERRRSGSHYTPRSLTQPIVATTFRPVFERLGPKPRAEQILELKVCDPAMGSGAFLVEACRFLGDKLVEAWNAHREMPAIPADEDPQLFARRMVAQRCLYGVDKNAFAVDLAKLSLWLATLAKDHPFTFLDHALRSGDSLVGLTRLQIAQFHWDTTRAHGLAFGQGELERTIHRVADHRKQILMMAEDNEASILLKQQKLDLADQALTRVRRAGDSVVAAFFLGETEREREQFRNAHLELYLHASKMLSADLEKETQLVDGLRGGRHPVTPFHWEVEFPEVFSRENPGFDAFVGNPPFLGGKRISTIEGDSYRDWLSETHLGTNSSADIVAHFYRGVFDLLRLGGCMGLVATNTISQGDTRTTGLQWICGHGGTIYSARKRLKWPGRAAVIVSVVYVCKEKLKGPFQLDDRVVSVISAYLFHTAENDDPARLLANKGRSFIGSIVLGMGFTFDDTDSSGVANPISEMQRLIEHDARNGQRIFPYIGGEELNESPLHSHARYVINFGEAPLRRDDVGKLWRDADDKERQRWMSSGIVPSDYPDEVAADWPDLLKIIEEKVYPERKGKPGSYSKQWWLFGRRNLEGQRALAGLPRVLALSRVSPHLSLALLQPGLIFAESVVAFALQPMDGLCLLQSRVHEIWARFFSSSLKDDLRYSPSDCFETFPFPANFEEIEILRPAGVSYFEFRAALMLRNNEGLTKTQNRFHDPEELSPDVMRLRDLHAAMDRAVLNAYDWKDIQPKCEFILDYEEEEDEEGSGRRRKKPWRYRWLDEIRDEVLARLLELNRKRAEEEQISGAAAEAAQGTPRSTVKRKRGKAATEGQGTLLGG